MMRHTYQRHEKLDGNKREDAKSCIVLVDSDLLGQHLQPQANDGEAQDQGKCADDAINVNPVSCFCSSCLHQFNVGQSI